MPWWPEDQDAVRATLRRGAIVKVDDSGDQQLVDIEGLASDKPQKIVRLLSHGFSSNPPLQAEGIYKSLGGRSDRGMFIGGEHKDYRQKNLPSGTAVLYDDKGNIIFAKGSDGIAIESKSGKVYVKPASGQFVYLGGTGADGTYDFVLTQSGPSINVKVRIG